MPTVLVLSLATFVPGLVTVLFLLCVWCLGFKIQGAGPVVHCLLFVSF